MGFFKAYDMRGTFGTDFDLDLVRRVGQALPGVLAGCNARRFGTVSSEAPRLLIGRDCRLSGDAVRDALVDGLVAAGARVTDLGFVTTPMVYYFTAVDGYDGSVMITASHNPPSDNGLKVSMRGALPVGYADGLDEVERRARAETPPAPAAVPGSVTAADAAETRRRYVAWQREHAAADLSGLRIAVDCSNGMSSLLICELLPEATVINDTPDGAFPAHSPNPLAAPAREQLAALVRDGGYDAGVIFDGDADRAMFLDERGAFVQPDFLIPLVARATRRFLGAPAASAVLHDVRTSRGAVETLRADGFTPVMVPVGHAFAKPKMRETAAICGGELAGHYYFGDFFGCDSGLLAALRILGEIAAANRAGLSFSRLMAPIVSRYANSGEINFKVDDKPAAIARALAAAAEAFPHELTRSTMDGIRIEYPDGWLNIRPSNTEPYLRLLVENRSPERLQAWLDILRRAIAG